MISKNILNLRIEINQLNNKNIINMIIKEKQEFKSIIILQINNHFKVL